SGTQPKGLEPRPPTPMTWRMVGVPAPVFPGFEFDILDRVPSEEKPDSIWHRDRARAILRAHPEVRELFGHEPSTAAWCVLAASLQLLLAFVAGFWLPWWGAILTAWFIGAPLNIVLFQLAHECDHHLVFKSSRWNRWLFTYTSLPMFFLGHHTWWIDHIIHHNDMSAPKDFVMRRRAVYLGMRHLPPLFVPYGAFVCVTQFLRTGLGLLLYLVTSLLRFRATPSDVSLAVLGDVHLVSGYKKEKIEFWAVAYPLISLAIFGALWWLAGWQAILYLAVSQVFFTGYLHPYCLGWVLAISHVHNRDRFQPTASHYGKWVNLTTFNAGLHVEHHDLMGIPWQQLPKLRRLAPEFYEDLVPLSSYIALALRFTFASSDRFISLFDTDTVNLTRRLITRAQKRQA
ncbi:MAG: fatty acid desaturase, partial [Planctomycetaceae bacterium]|nr:fatty acid desaturase [Planctomycetaceae bacterium]